MKKLIPILTVFLFGCASTERKLFQPAEVRDASNQVVAQIDLRTGRYSISPGYTAEDTMLLLIMNSQQQSAMVQQCQTALEAAQPKKKVAPTKPVEKK